MLLVLLIIPIIIKELDITERTTIVNGFNYMWDDAIVIF